MQPELTVFDSSTLINFLAVDRLDLLFGLQTKLLVSDVVRAEIIEDFQFERLEEAISQGFFEEASVQTINDHKAFVSFIDGGLGRGESSSIVVAHVHGAALAIDDKTAIKRARKAHPKLVIITTANIMVSAIRRSEITVDEADELKRCWAAEHRFVLTIDSFASII